MNISSWLLIAALAASSWPQWRGPGRDGLAPAFPDPARWPASLTKVWTARVGIGHASPVVSGGRVYVFARDGEDEVLSCLDLATGRPVWRQSYAAPYTVNPAAASHGKGPKATPIVAGGRVHTFGISGTLSTHDAATGKLLWRKEGTPPDFGAAQSPLVDGDVLVLHVGRGLTGFDAGTGTVRWTWTGDGPAYASPVVAVVDGVRQVVTQTEKSVLGVSLDRGALLWQVPFETAYAQNAVTPVVVGDLLVYSGLDKGVHAARIVHREGRWALEEKWAVTDASFYMSAPVADGGALYGFSHKRRGELVSLDLETGRLRWRSEARQGDNASVVATPRSLLLLTTEGVLTASAKGGDRFAPAATYTVATSAVWAHPAVVAEGIVVKDVDSVTLWRP